MRPPKIAAAIAAVLLGGTWARAARADDEPPGYDGSPYQLDWAVDAPVFGLGLVGLSLNFVEVRPAPCLPSCQPPDDLNALDRTALGNYSPSAHTAADVLVISLLAVPQIANLIDSRGRGWLEDTAIFLQALLLTQGATQIFKGVTQRGAPVLYDERVPLEEREGRDATRSFFSGHTSTAFMAATSYSVTYWLRHPDDPWRWVVLAATHSVALSVGLLKIHAGYHYPTDIAAGAIAGSSIGALVPLLHRRF